MHSPASIFGDYEPSIDVCFDHILWEDRNTNGNFIRDVMWHLNYDDDAAGRLVEVDVEQHVLQPQQPINVEGAPLKDWVELPDEEVAVVRWEVQLKDMWRGSKKLDWTLFNIIFLLFIKKN